MLIQRGEVLQQQGHAAEAERLFRDLLSRLEAGAAYDTAYDHAYTLWDLGRCLEAQGQPAQAIEWHRKALGEFERLRESNESEKRMAAVCHLDWADNLASIGQFDEAQKHYEAALPVLRELDDRRSVGVALGQLGTLAQRRGDLPEAARRHAEALETFRALGEPQMEAVAWHQLGRVADEAENWDEAERCYRESLRLDEQMNDAQGMAQTCNQLAKVAKGAGRLDDAERWHLRAIELGEQLGDRKGLAVRLNNLADLYLSQRRFDEAARCARRAVEIQETLDLSAEPWKTYSILAQIAQAQGRANEAAQWRRKEQDSFAAYAGASHEMRQYQPLIQAVVAACQGNEEAKRQLEPTLQSMENVDEVNRRFAQAARHILAGERDAEKLTEDLERIGALMVRAILRQLAGEGTPTPNPSPAGAGEGELAHPAPMRGADGAQAGAGEGANAAVARIRQQWNDVIRAVVAACEGNAEAAAQLAPFLEEMSQQADWRKLVAVLRRILAGERDPLALLPGLDDTDVVIAGDVLRGLGIDVPLAGQEEEEGDASDMLKLDDFLAMIVQACRPDAPPGLGEQLYNATRGMASQPNAPSGIRELGRALNEILSGERDPDLSALPPQLADKVRGVLDALGS